MVKGIEGTKRVTDVARLLQVTDATVYRWIKADKLHAVKVGQSFRVTDEEIERFVGTFGDDEPEASVSPIRQTKAGDDALLDLAAGLAQIADALQRLIEERRSV